VQVKLHGVASCDTVRAAPGWLARFGFDAGSYSNLFGKS